MTERRPGRGALAVLVLIGLAVGAALAEVAVRAAGYRPALLDPGMFVAINDDLCPFGLKPGWKGYYCGKEVTVDQDGRRVVVSPIRPRLSPGEQARRKVLLLGDSVVFGQGLHDDETFASRLQQRFDAARIPWKVENIGVPAYSTENELGALRRYLATSTPSRVVVIWVSNDPTNSVDPLGIRSGEFRQLSSDLLHRTLAWTYRHWYSLSLVAESAKRLVQHRDPPDMDRNERLDLLQRSVDALQAMRQLTESHGIELRVGVYFDNSMAAELGKQRSWTAAVLFAMQKAGLRPFEVISHVRKLPRAEVTVALNDPHPSARAVNIAVEDIERELEGPVGRAQGHSTPNGQ